MKRHFKLINYFMFILIFILGLLLPTSINAESRLKKNNGLSEEFFIKKTINLLKKTSNLNKNVLSLALKAYACARTQGVVKSDIITIIDFSQPSYKERLWVLDVGQEKSLFETYVAHGKNSGDIYSKQFSDIPESRQSSIGVYTTGGIYHGAHGESLQLHGKEPGFNAHAFTRHIVMHGANYVGENFVQNYGYLGRSFGCPAVSYPLITPIIRTIKNGSLLFAYYPDTQWMSQSKFLNC